MQRTLLSGGLVRPLSNPLQTLADFVRAAVALVARWRERARSRHMLSSMDARLLKDIGVSRATAEFEANKPFWER
jgi:uncharacterized protein YjiS (DUF1127 family)